MTFWDKLQLALVLTAAVASFFAVEGALGSSASTQAVNVSVSGAPVATYHLSEKRTVRINGVGGDCILKIDRGQVRVMRSDCPKNLCVRQGPIGADGGTIVCLPHRVVVSGVEAEAVTIDAVSQ